MSETEVDLSGDWLGLYNYPQLYPPTRFRATLRDDGGRISGETVEQEENFSGGAELRALIDGHREGASVTFAKIYEDEAFNSEFVRYEGEIGAGGDEISGQWVVPGHWSGTFIMVRSSGAAEAAERRIAETIDQS